MGTMERILIGLALVAVLLGLRLATRRFRLPPPPLLLPLAAVLLWCLLGNTVRPAGLQWLGAVDELATAYALIALLAWLTLECPEALGWWRPVAKILRDLLSLGLSALATVLVLQRLANLNLVGLVTTSAVLTAVIGLAAQESLKDLFAGIELQVDPPFREGDWISVGEESGTVESLHLMSTRLRRTDGSTVNLPNNTVADNPMKRFNQYEPVGDRFRLSLGYEIPPARARQLLLRVMADNPLVLQEPPPEVWVSAYDDSQVRYELLAYQQGASEGARLRLRSGLLEQIWYALERQGWEFPSSGAGAEASPDPAGSGPSHRRRCLPDGRTAPAQLAVRRAGSRPGESAGPGGALPALRLRGNDRGRRGGGRRPVPGGGWRGGGVQGRWFPPGAVGGGAGP